jgi:hypothetical protein
MGVSRGDNFRPRLVDLIVNRKGRDVDRSRTFDDIAVLIDTDEVGGFDLAETHAERIDPERVGELRVARRDVACDPFAEAERGEDAEAAGKALLAVLPLLGGSAEHRLRELPEDRRIGTFLGAIEPPRHCSAGIKWAHRILLKLPAWVMRAGLTTPV